MRYKLIIFDFDGTLANSFPLFVEAITEAVERFGLRSLDASSIDNLRNYSAREIITYLGIPFWKVPSVGRFVRGRMAQRIASISLFSGVEELLEQLSAAGVVLSIVSSNSETNIRTILGPEKAQLISVYECGASLFGKASKFRRVLKRTGISTAETICIGDEIRDIEAAQSEKFDFGAVSWGYTNVEGLARFSPAHLFNRPEEIYQAVV